MENHPSFSRRSLLKRLVTTLKWNSPELKIDLPAANVFVRRDYRDGSKIQGLG